MNVARIENVRRGSGTGRHHERRLRAAAVAAVVVLTATLTGCELARRIFGGGAPDLRDHYSALFRPHTYDVAAGATLVRTFEDIGRLTAVNFEWEPELRSVVDELNPRLPQLRGLRVDELLQVLPEIVTRPVFFEYDYLPNRTVRLRLHYLAEET